MTVDPTWWTEQRVKRLTELRARGWSSQQIAADLGTGRNAVVGKISRLRLPLPAKPAPVKPAPKPREPKPEMTGDPVPFLDTGPWHCRALFEQKGPAGELMCCGMQVEPGRSYCAPHCDLYYHLPQPATARSHHGKAGYRQ